MGQESVACNIQLETEGNPPFEAMWMTLEDTVLSDTSQVQQDPYCVLSLVYGSFKRLWKGDCLGLGLEGNGGMLVRG